MAKRRIVLSSQEMSDIKKRIETLEAQLTRSNARVLELESGLNEIKDVACGKDAADLPGKFAKTLEKLIKRTINPPVTRREMPELEAEAS